MNGSYPDIEQWREHREELLREAERTRASASHAPDYLFDRPLHGHPVPLAYGPRPARQRCQGEEEYMASGPYTRP